MGIHLRHEREHVARNFHEDVRGADLHHVALVVACHPAERITEIDFCEKVEPRLVVDAFHLQIRVGPFEGGERYGDLFAVLREEEEVGNIALIGADWGRKEFGENFGQSSSCIPRDVLAWRLWSEGRFNLEITEDRNLRFILAGFRFVSIRDRNNFRRGVLFRICALLFRGGGDLPCLNVLCRGIGVGGLRFSNGGIFRCFGCCV
ncbi:MAG: hypothetical protein BWY82_02411 [Verrucomicrobia bacterium ADurb.Bin474]|nr:MAG: hypothetical protein BWY82_02411 [Verrucomicrobia bacterium ADurb.Bin474]